MRARLIAILLVLPLAACQHLAEADAPATLLAPGNACIAQMAAFATAQTGRSVTLTAQAFESSDALLLERPLLRGPDGLPLNGRELGRPEVFHLRKSGGTCVMVYDKSGAQQPLDACTCAATTAH